jgi:hypothetical protein
VPYIVAGLHQEPTHDDLVDAFGVRYPLLGIAIRVVLQLFACCVHTATHTTIDNELCGIHHRMSSFNKLVHSKDYCIYTLTTTCKNGMTNLG